MQSGGVYLFTVNAVANKLQEQQWWEEWNSTQENITDGSKTYNLERFLQQLRNLTSDLMREKSQPIVGRFCYAIQRN
ncbi:MAG: hypothetical protein SAK29_38640 [Scytonema sp. PMC 1069.18]|nr:hypothetical protein [Scytonema sp. PMC 1069.18]MEC4887018.1 hypothetical protein [Scytonema sp. PMC 1070.18]